MATNKRWGRKAQKFKTRGIYEMLVEDPSYGYFGVKGSDCSPPVLEKWD